VHWIDDRLEFDVPRCVAGEAHGVELRTLSRSSPLLQQIPKCKLVFLGSAGVSKTSFVNRFIDEQFTRDYEKTIGINYFTKTNTVNDGPAVLHIWDTAGQERFDSLITSFISETQIAILVSFIDPQLWHQSVVEHGGNDARRILPEPKSIFQKGLMRLLLM
jgi:GTPase SAR1 family protein